MKQQTARTKGTLRILQSRGFTLAELIIGAGILSLSMLAVAAFSQILLNFQKDLMNKKTSGNLRTEIVRNLLDSKDWVATLYDPANSGDEKPFNCIVKGTDCAGKGGPSQQLTIRSAMGANNVFNSQTATAGFDEKGRVCNSFSESTPDLSCPFRYDIYWSPVCPSVGPCLNPRLKVLGKFKKVPGADPENKFMAALMDFEVSPKPDPLKEPSLLDEVFYVAAGETTNFEITKPNIGLREDSYSIALKSATSELGVNVSLSGRNLNYQTPRTTVNGNQVNISGLDRVEYVLHYPNGKTYPASIWIKVVQPYSWTGKAGDGLWSNPENWCGNVEGHKCLGANSAPGSSDDVLFDDTCVNCDSQVDVNANVRSISLGGLPRGSDNKAKFYGRLTATRFVDANTFRINAGTFDGNPDANAYTIRVRQNLYVDGGVFRAPKEILLLGNLYSLSPQSFLHNDGRIVFSGTYGTPDTSRETDDRVPTILIGENTEDTSVRTAAATTINLWNVSFAGRAHLGGRFNVNNITVSTMEMGTYGWWDGAASHRVESEVNISGNIYHANAGTYARGYGMLNFNMVGTNDQIVYLNTPGQNGLPHLYIAANVSNRRVSFAGTNTAVGLDGSFRIHHDAVVDFSHLTRMWFHGRYSTDAQVRIAQAIPDNVEVVLDGAAGATEFLGEIVVQGNFIHAKNLDGFNLGAGGRTYNGGPVKIEGTAVTLQYQDWNGAGNVRFVLSGIKNQTVTGLAVRGTNDYSNNPFFRIPSFEVAKTGGTASFSGFFNFNRDFIVTSGNVDWSGVPWVWFNQSYGIATRISAPTVQFNNVTIGGGAGRTTLDNELQINGSLTKGCGETGGNPGCRSVVGSGTFSVKGDVELKHAITGTQDNGSTSATQLKLKMLGGSDSHIRTSLVGTYTAGSISILDAHLIVQKTPGAKVYLDTDVYIAPQDTRDWGMDLNLDIRSGGLEVGNNKLDVNGNITVAAGASLNAGSNTITVNRLMTVSGSFAKSGGILDVKAKATGSTVSPTALTLNDGASITGSGTTIKLPSDMLMNGTSSASCTSGTFEITRVLRRSPASTRSNDVTCPFTFQSEVIF